MSRDDGLFDEMPRSSRRRRAPAPLDDDTAARLIDGALDARDAPPGYGTVVGVLAAAAAPPTAEELSGETAAREAFATARQAGPHVQTVRRRGRVPVRWSLRGCSSRSWAGRPLRRRVRSRGICRAWPTTFSVASASRCPTAVTKQPTEPARERPRARRVAGCQRTRRRDAHGGHGHETVPRVRVGERPCTGRALRTARRRRCRNTGHHRPRAHPRPTAPA